MSPHGPSARDAGPDLRPLDILAAALALGLIGGWAEAMGTMVKRHLFDQPVWLGRQVLWMAPLVGGLLASLAALGSQAALWWLPKPRLLTLVTGIVAFLTSWSFLLAIGPDLQEYARVALALGIAVQGARVVSARPQVVRRAGRAVPALLLLLAAVPVVQALGLRMLERNRLARLGTAPKGAPNVLLITIDTERAESLELHGGPPGTSPALNRLAGEGVVFDRAIATSSWTLPSHASLFTGRDAHEVSANWLRPLDRTFPTLAERFGARGYQTAGFAGNTFYCTTEFGLHRGFLHYEDFVTALDEVVLSHGLVRRIANSARFRQAIDFEDIIARRTAGQLNRAFLRWLDARRDRPFFAFLNYFEPHAPYAPPPAYRAMFGAVKLKAYLWAEHRLRLAWIPDPRRQWGSDSDNETSLRAYHGAIASADAELGALLDELGRRGLLDDTIVIVTSDHGEQFGEQWDLARSERLFTHGNSLYAQVIWVPLVIRFPGKVPPGLRVQDPVSLRDVPATVVALSGVLEAGAFPGTPLSALWGDRETDAPPSPVLSSVIPYDRKDEPDGWIASLVSGRYHYIKYGSGQTELFDLREDPTETRNLAAEPDSQLSRVTRSLDAELQRALGGRPVRPPGSGSRARRSG